MGNLKFGHSSSLRRPQRSEPHQETSVTPILEPIKPLKRENALFNLHRYFSKKDWNVIEAYIANFSSENDLVLDPFVGSGISGLAALKCRRRFMGFDLLSWACFIARETAKPVPIKSIERGFVIIEKSCKERVEGLYRTKDSDLIQIINELDIPDAPIPAFLIRKHGPQTLKELFYPRQLIALMWLKESIERLPDAVIRNQFKLCFSNILPRISKTYFAKPGKPTSGDSNIFKNANFTFAKGAYALELPVWPAFERRVEALKRAKNEAEEMFGSFYKQTTFKVEHGDAISLLKKLSDNSIDYIITDPPYDGRVQYGDLSLLWNAWLGFDDRHLASQEITVNPDRQITDSIYIERMMESMKQMGRVLKERQWLTLIYANTNLNYWKAILDAAEEGGLGFVNMVLQPANLKQFKKFCSPGSTTSDNLMVNFQKKKSTRKRSSLIPLTNTEEYLKLEIERCIIECLGASTDEIAAHLANWILTKQPAGTSYDSIGSIMGLLRKYFYFEREGADAGRWFHFPGDELHGKLPWDDRIRYSIYNLLRDGQKKALEEINAYIAEAYAVEENRQPLPPLQRIVENIAELDPLDKAYYVLSKKLVTQYRLRLKGLLPDRVDELLKSLVQKRAQIYKPIILRFLPAIDNFKEKYKDKKIVHYSDFLVIVEALTVAIEKLQQLHHEIEQIICAGSIFKDMPTLDDYVLIIVLRDTVKRKHAFIEKVVKEVFMPVLDQQGIDLNAEVKTLSEHSYDLAEFKSYNNLCKSGLSFTLNNA